MKWMILIPAILSLVLTAPDSHAGVVASKPPEDAQLVEDSPLIVVGYLLPRQVRHVEWPATVDNRKGWEYWAPLKVKEVIKGDFDSKRAVIVLHLGIEPVSGGEWVHPELSVPVPSRDGRTSDSLELYHWVGDMITKEPFLANGNEKAIWFLTKSYGMLGRDHEGNLYGIAKPWETQPVEMKPYFEAYLKPDPETELRKILKDHPEWAARANPYLNRREVQRIQQIEDLDERIEALMPLYLKQVKFGNRLPAREALIQAGEPAGEALVDVFHDPEHRNMRADIIYAWGDIAYPESIPVVIEMLESQGEDLEDVRARLRENPDDETAQQSLARLRSETYAAASLLEIAGASKALPELREAEQRWDGEDEAYLRKKIDQAIERLETLE